MRYAVFIVLAALTVVGCKKRTELTVLGVKAGPAAAELAMLLKTFGIIEDPRMVTTAEGVTIKFRYELPAAERQTIEQAFQRLKKIEPASRPLFRMKVTEARPEVLKAMGLKADGDNEFPFRLRLSNGKHQLRDLTFGVTTTRICSYDIPIYGKLPSLDFHINVPEDMPPGPKRELLETLSKVPMTAEHEVVGADAALTRLAKKMKIRSDHVSFVFSEKDQYGKWAFEHEVDECARKSVDKGSHAFFVNLLFPNLARAYTGHKFKDDN